MEQHGIKEIREAMEGLMEMSLCMIEVMGDGLDLSDIGAVWDKFKNDKEFENKMKLALEGASKIPEEMKDLSLQEGMELLMVMLPYIPKMVDSFSKKKAP